MSEYDTKVPFVKGLIRSVMDRAQKEEELEHCWVECVDSTCGSQIILVFTNL